MSNYKYYRNLVLFICIPNLILFSFAIILHNKTLANVWAISCLIYFIAFVIQPEKASFKIK